MKRVVLATGLALLLAGCSGIKFAPVPLNNALPQSFKERTLYPRTEIFRHQLPELAGSILYRKGGTNEFDRGARVIKPGVEVPLQTIKETDAAVYSSKIDRGASVQGSYLAFAASLGEKQTASVDMRDTVMVFIHWNDVPLDELSKLVQSPNPNPGTHRYWVQAALVTAITIDNYAEISTSASGVLGETFGAKGNAYNKQGATTHDYWISMELLDLEKLLGNTKGIAALPAPGSSERQEFVKKLKADTVKIEKVKWTKAN